MAESISLQVPVAGPPLSVLVQSLPLELREKIYKEYLAEALRQREALGWGKVNREIDGAFFCHKRQQITRMSICGRNRLCKVCLSHGEIHYFELPWLDSWKAKELFYDFILNL